MGSCPSLARSLLIAADREHDDISLLGHFDCFGNLAAILFRIAGHDRVFAPGATNSDLATFAVEDFGAIADALFNSIEDCDVVTRNSAITTEQAPVRVRPDNSDGLQLLET